MVKKLKFLVFTTLLASLFCCTAFAGTSIQKGSLLTGNVATGVVYDEPEIDQTANPANSVGAAQVFQVKSVRVYPVYVKPEAPETYLYNKNIYAERTIPGTNWGQNNFLRLSPAGTQRLLHSYDDIGYEVSYWKMEMDCYVANFKRPARFQFKSLDGSKTISEGAYNGSKKFELVFPVQDTTEQYGNGYDGTFSYYSDTGKYVSLMAGGYVYLNATNPNTQ